MSLLKRSPLLLLSVAGAITLSSCNLNSINDSLVKMKSYLFSSTFHVEARSHLRYKNCSLPIKLVNQEAEKDNSFAKLALNVEDLTLERRDFPSDGIRYHSSYYFIDLYIKLLYARANEKKLSLPLELERLKTSLSEIIAGSEDRFRIDQPHGLAPWDEYLLGEINYLKGGTKNLEFAYMHFLRALKPLNTQQEEAHIIDTLIKPIYLQNAYLRLHEMYKNGIGTLQNKQRAYQILEQGASLCDPALLNVKFNYAKALEQNKLRASDPNITASKLYEDLAAVGSKYALKEILLKYLTSKNDALIEKALDYTRISASHEQLIGVLALADIVYNTAESDHQISTAYSLFDLACKQYKHKKSCQKTKDMREDYPLIEARPKVRSFKAYELSPL